MILLVPETCRVLFSVPEEGLRPYKASVDSAAWDLRVAADYTILPGETKLLRTALHIALPQGYEAQIRPRSGLSARSHLRIANSPGTIDADYRDEISIIAQNTFSSAHLKESLLSNEAAAAAFAANAREVNYGTYYAKLYGSDKASLLCTSLAQGSIFLDEWEQPWGTIYLKKYERIAQILIAACSPVYWEECELTQLKQQGSDRGGGFGHSGSN